MVPKTLIPLFVCGASLCFQQCLAATPLFDYERRILSVDDFAGIPTKYAPLFAFNTTGPVIGRGACKVSPGDAAWPSQDEWDALNKMVGGALIKTTPIGAHCYYDWGIYDVEKCKALVKDWTVPYTHMNDPTSVMWPLYEGASCIPTVDAANSSCSLGGYPAYVVNVTTVAQIQAAVNFARNKGLRVVIKNTGHDYLGKSSGAGALSIWTHHLQRLDYMDNLEIGHFKGKAIHAGSGVRGLDVSRTAYENGASAVGGMCASVGFAGGFFSGGGLSPLSSVFGMAADHILSIGVVTADGNFVVATEESHSELFWAIRGGGGSTWGVVTSVSVRLLPSVPLTTTWFEFQTSEAVSNDTFWKGVQACFENFEPFTESGFYGFVNIRRNYSGYNNSDYSFALEPLMAPNSSIELVKEATKPLFDRLTELGIPFTQELKHYDTFFDGWTATWPDNELYVAGPMAVEGTRFFPATTLISQDGLNAIRKASELGFDISGVNTSPRNPFNVDNAINPALRDAIVFLGSGISFPQYATAQQKSAAQEKLMANLLVPWREVAPASKMGGSYLNEANPMEFRWQEDFYGSNYPRLSNVKRRYDPHGVFYATTGVGSEEWEVRTKDQGIQTQNGPLCRI